VRIYTRGGDSGETGLFGGGRVPKDHPRIEACGAVDELNAFLGRALDAVQSDPWKERLRDVQHDLFTLGSHLATPAAAEGSGPKLPELPAGRVDDMEGWIDELDRELPPLANFIIPGGSRGAVELHVCRTVCRRAERAVVTVRPRDPAAELTIRYLNRLSDLLFTIARSENHRSGVEDVRWRRGRSP
jgi:cob(I)alamin adenosyltransferase